MKARTALAAVAVISLMLAFVGCGDQQQKQQQAPSSQQATTGRPVGQAAKNLPQVQFETSMGDFTVELWPDTAPGSVKNFLTYVGEKFYDGTVFHRVEPESPIVIQGGGYLPDMTYKDPTHPPIRNEASPSASNLRGTIAMARTTDPDSASTQFYINMADNVSLDKGKAPDGHGYCVFGRVIDGLSILDAMMLVKTAPVGPHKTCPINPIVIKSVKKIK